MKKMMVAVAMMVGFAAVATSAQGQVVVKHIQSEKSPIAAGVWAGDTFYLSGQLASPITPADAAKGTAADYGDTKAQAASVFATSVLPTPASPSSSSGRLRKSISHSAVERSRSGCFVRLSKAS